MRKFNWLLSAMMVLALSFVACTPTPDDDKNKPTPPAPLQFEVSLGESTMTTVTYSVTPSDLEAEYLVVAYGATAVEQYATDAELVQKIYADIETYAQSNNQTLEEYVAGVVKKGVIEDAVIEGLASDTKYYLLVFGVDAANGYASTTDLNKSSFRTQAPATNNCTFTLKVEACLTNAAFDVTPSDLNQIWTIATIEEDVYKTYIDEDGEYGWTRSEFFQNYVTTAIADLKKDGLNDADIATKLLHTGVKTLSVCGLKPKTKYVAFVGGVKVEGDNVFVETQVREVYYRSGEEAASDLTFDITVTNINQYSADIKIVPSDLNAEYYYYISYIDTKKRDAKPIDIASAAVTEYLYYWEEYTKLCLREPSKGVVDLSNYELNIADTEYFVVAFSFEPNPSYYTLINEETGEYDTNPGTITSAPTYVSFMTPGHGDPMAAEFNFKASNVGPYDFKLDIECNDPTVYYMPGIAYYGNFDEAQIMSDYGTLLSQIIQMCMEGQSPCLTIQEALETKCGAYCRNGSGSYYIANLNPETEFMAYVLVIDCTTGKLVRCVQSDLVATTTAIGSITPEIEILGIYDGNEEAGSVFGNADLTTGCFIAVATHKNIDGATSLFGAISEGDATDTNSSDHQLSDTYIYTAYRGYWSNINLDVPYEFYVAEWDGIYTLLSYATDSTGRAGHVARKLINTQGAVETGTIAELQAYYNEAQAAKATQAIKSLVIEESREPQMTCIWSEEVGAPRAAEVIYHDVEPLEFFSDIVLVKSIKSLHF